MNGVGPITTIALTSIVGGTKVANMSEGTNTTVSRRSTRLFVGEQGVDDAGNTGRTGQDSRYGSSSDEKELEKPQKKAPSSSSIDVHRIPIINLGKEMHGIFPVTVEDMGKQVTECLRAAKAIQTSRVEGRPINFGIVLPGAVYRSSFPTKEDFQFLKTLGLKTVVSLVKKDFAVEFTEFMKGQRIRHIVIEMQGTKKVDIPEAIMNSIMKVALNKAYHPLLIHCNHGKHRTGCAVAVMRHVSGWQVDSILEEYTGFAEPKVRECDVKYITDYQVSNLLGLFTKKTRNHTPLTTTKMAKYFIATAFVLLIWIVTSLFWNGHY